MSELTLVGLRVTVEVARWGSFTAAAAALGYTQSAVSRQISATEAAVGSPVFKREARGVRPTRAGTVLLAHARKVIAQVEATESELAGLQDRLAGRLTVSAYPTASASLVPRAMVRLQADHPGLAVTLWEGSSPAQVRRLRSGRTEVAVVAIGEGLPDHDLDGLRREVVPIRRGLGIAVHAAHPLAGRDEVDVVEIADARWIVGVGGEGDPQFGPWPTIDRPTVAYEARGWSSRLGMVAAGLGVTVVPQLAADIVPTGVRWLHVTDPALVHRRETVILTARDRSPAASAMVTALHDELARYAA
ncbi:LysR family transcriptional regulator [Actinomycetospora flava]|uniref:LysR family transcriptional regulator n=1 Tax=Actinomycetospora flava TaxID=3129232 RepID=A0ABU8MCR3_9PSEU